MSRDFFATAASRRSIAHRREEAARWFVTLQNAELSERVLRSWKKWESVPENREAFDAIERIWDLADSMPELPVAGPEERAADGYDGSVPISSWQARRAAASAASPVRRFARPAFGLAAAAAIVMVVALALPLQSFLQLFTNSTAPDRTVVVETGLAEHKQLVFEEGTRIQLGAQTSITASFTKTERSITLDRGEGSFSVARDPKRPFQVRAGGGTITAVGTAFNVYHRQDSDVIVSVTEGVVEVAPGGQGPAQLRIARGQEVTYDAAGNVGPIRRADVTNSDAWRTGYFRYTREPLRHVVEDVNRYSRLQLSIHDVAVGDLLYSGTVFTTDIREFTAGLERIYPQIEVVANDDSHALIRARAPAETARR